MSGLACVLVMQGMLRRSFWCNKIWRYTLRVGTGRAALTLRARRHTAQLDIHAHPKPKYIYIYIHMLPPPPKTYLLVASRGGGGVVPIYIYNTYIYIYMYICMKYTLLEPTIIGILRSSCEDQLIFGGWPGESTTCMYVRRT